MSKHLSLIEKKQDIYISSDKTDGKYATEVIPVLHLRRRKLHKVSFLLQLSHEGLNDTLLVLKGFF